MKWLGIIGMFAAAAMTYVTWSDSLEGFYVRVVATVTGTVSVFAYFEGLKREIVAETRDSIRNKGKES